MLECPLLRSWLSELSELVLRVMRRLKLLGLLVQCSGKLHTFTLQQAVPLHTSTSMSKPICVVTGKTCF